MLAPGAALVDIHGHTGFNDPDGFTFSAEQLVATLEAAGARGVVMSMHEPDGYPPANDRVLAEAAASDGRLVAFCRLDPKRDAVAEARRCLDAGARGIKLHPRAEGFELRDPEVEPIFALAHERRLPILIHAGRGIPTLARDAVALAERYPEARIVLAHAAICDLNWLWRVIPRYPNLLIDTAWWHPVDLAALFALVPPGQLVFGSDLPYFTPFMSATMAVRFGLQVGLSPEQLAGILGLQGERLLDGGEPLDLGPAPGPGRLAYSVLLERLTSVLVLAVGRMLMGRTGYEPLALARLACESGTTTLPRPRSAATCSRSSSARSASRGSTPATARRSLPGSARSCSPRRSRARPTYRCRRCRRLPRATRCEPRRMPATGRSRRPGCTASSYRRCRRICAIPRPRTC